MIRIREGPGLLHSLVYDEYDGEGAEVPTEDAEGRPLTEAQLAQLRREAEDLLAALPAVATGSNAWKWGLRRCRWPLLLHRVFLVSFRRWS